MPDDDVMPINDLIKRFTTGVVPLDVLYERNPRNSIDWFWAVDWKFTTTLGLSSEVKIEMKASGRNQMEEGFKNRTQWSDRAQALGARVASSESGSDAVQGFARLVAPAPLLPHLLLLPQTGSVWASTNSQQATTCIQRAGTTSRCWSGMGIVRATRARTPASSFLIRGGLSAHWLTATSTSPRIGPCEWAEPVMRTWGGGRTRQLHPHTPPACPPLPSSHPPPVKPSAPDPPDKTETRSHLHLSPPPPFAAVRACVAPRLSRTRALRQSMDVTPRTASPCISSVPRNRPFSRHSTRTRRDGGARLVAASTNHHRLSPPPPPPPPPPLQSPLLPPPPLQSPLPPLLPPLLPPSLPSNAATNHDNLRPTTALGGEGGVSARRERSSPSPASASGLIDVVRHPKSPLTPLHPPPPGTTTGSALVAKAARTASSRLRCSTTWSLRDGAKSSNHRTRGSHSYTLLTTADQTQPVASDHAPTATSQRPGRHIDTTHHRPPTTCSPPPVHQGTPTRLCDSALTTARAARLP